MEVPPELLHRAAEWENLKRWERKELGQELRRLGFTYWEIRQIIPVPKGTLAGWCRDMPLNEEQLERVRKSGNRKVAHEKTGAKLHQRNVERVAKIREAARHQALSLLSDVQWFSGVVAYWGEGDKRTNEVGFSNSDPGLVVFFINWAEKYFNLGPDRFTISLHLHDGQDESERKHFWSQVTGIPPDQFRKTFWKEEGTGHRKNLLYNGTASIRVTKSSNLLHVLFGWIDVVRGLHGRRLDSSCWAVGVIGNAGDS